MLYVAQPVIVEAHRIVSVENVPDADPALARNVATDDGMNRRATAEMCARYIPNAGDFWVVQADGYEYLKPKEVFERKYTPKAA